MNEWELQEALTLQWIKCPLRISGIDYFLVAWELMFPSWEINHKSKKWNEVSIDFIFFDGQETYLCLELKNNIKSRKPLLSAFCQTLHRTSLFREQYNPEKMRRVNKYCFDKMHSYRVQEVENKVRTFDFPETAQVIPILAAREFPENGKSDISKWNDLGWNEFEIDLLNYTMGKEMDRLYNQGAKPFKVEILCI